MAQKLIQPVSLPPWAKLGGRPRDLQHVEIDATEAYPMILAELGVEGEPSAFDVEVARNFIFWDVLVGMRSRQLEIRIKDPDHRWALKNFKGDPVDCPACGGRNPACRRCSGTGKMAAIQAGTHAARNLYANLRGIAPR